MAADYVPILDIMKIGSAFFFLCIELFTHCYLFEIIEIKISKKFKCINSTTILHILYRKMALLLEFTALIGQL